jgi:hypothetical protein
VLVGGSTRIPKVQALSKEYFDARNPTRGSTRTRLLLFGPLFKAVSSLVKVAMTRRISFFATWLLSRKALRLLVES